MINQIGDVKKENYEESEMKTVAKVNLGVKAKFLQVDILCRCNKPINHLSL